VSTRLVRALLLAAVSVSVLMVLAIVRSAYDEAPTPQERRCQQLRIAANEVPSREDTVEDELEYLRRAELAERACAAVG
jgi:hypothetical protein